MDSVLNKLTGFSQAVTDWFLLSIAWLIGVALGAVLFGVAPATTALLGATRERFVEGSGASAWGLFWRNYRKWFNSSSRSLLPSVIILGFLIGDYVLARSLFGGVIRATITVVIGVLIVVVGLGLIHQMRAFVGDEVLGLVEGLRRALKRPLHNLVFATATFAILRLGALLYGFILLLAPGVWAWLVVVSGKRIDQFRQ